MKKHLKVMEVKKDHHFKNMLKGLKFDSGTIEFDQCLDDCFGDVSKLREAETEV